MNTPFRKEYKRINTKYLFVDDLYQRRLDTHRVNKIVQNFNPNLVNSIKVSFRDGKYWVIDGHHTMAALIAKNGGKDLLVDCLVFYGMTWIDEVSLFLEQNGAYARTVSINDRLRAMNNAGDPSVSKMVKLTEKSGLVISFNGHKGNNRIVALSTLTKVFANLTEEEYSEYLSLLKKTWGGSQESLSREILQGMYVFYKTYSGKFSPKAFVNRLQKVSPYAIIRDGRVSASPGASKYARQILGYYNHHAKDRLPDLL